MLEYITQGIGRGGFEEGRLPVLLHIECVQLHETWQAEHFHADHAELILCVRRESRMPAGRRTESRQR